MERVRDLMTRWLLTVAPGTRVSTARDVARENAVRHLLVTRGKDLVGVLCTCDLYDAADDDPIAARMRRRVFTIEPDASIEETAERMRTRRIGCLPVVSQGVLVGILTRGDLRRHGVPDERLGVLHCASCGWTHGVIANPGTPEVGFCRYCRERSVPDDPLDMGGSG